MSRAFFLAHMNQMMGFMDIGTNRGSERIDCFTGETTVNHNQSPGIIELFLHHVSLLIGFLGLLR